MVGLVVLGLLGFERLEGVGIKKRSTKEQRSLEESLFLGNDRVEVGATRTGTGLSWERESEQGEEVE